MIHETREDELKDAIEEIVFGKKDRYYTGEGCNVYGGFTATFQVRT